MKVYHRRPKIEPLGRRAAINEGGGRYYGWTGYESFGVIWPFRYYGWRVTCWATVMAAAYGDARTDPFFYQFKDAVRALDCLIDLADSMGELVELRESMGVDCGQRVPEWRGPLGWKPDIWTSVDFRFIQDDFVTNSRAPTSPASWMHFMQRHPPIKPDLARQLGGRIAQ